MQARIADVLLYITDGEGESHDPRAFDPLAAHHFQMQRTYGNLLWCLIDLTYLLLQQLTSYSIHLLIDHCLPRALIPF